MKILKPVTFREFIPSYTKIQQAEWSLGYRAGVDPHRVAWNDCYKVTFVVLRYNLCHTAAQYG